MQQQLHGYPFTSRRNSGDSTFGTRCESSICYSACNFANTRLPDVRDTISLQEIASTGGENREVDETEAVPGAGVTGVVYVPTSALAGVRAVFVLGGTYSERESGGETIAGVCVRQAHPTFLW